MVDFLVRKAWYARGIKVSIGVALLLLAYVAFSGSYVMSVLFCPVWLLFSILKNAIQRPGWGLAFLRIMAPALTLGLVLGNNSLQWTIAEANAPLIIAACEEFHAANGKYPQTLDDLVPQYLPSVPRAKYCLADGEFRYWYLAGNPILEWCVVPPYNRKIYSFSDSTWGQID